MPQTFVYSAISQLTRFGKLDFWVFMATREPHLHQCAAAAGDAWADAVPPDAAAAPGWLSAAELVQAEGV